MSLPADFQEGSNVKASKMRKAEEGQWHTRQWYKENVGVDPLEKGLEFFEVQTPIKWATAPFKVWEETIVFPFRDEKGIREYAKNKNARRKALAAESSKLKELLTTVKSGNVRINEIFNRLWEIEARIIEVSISKDECSENDYDYDKKGLRQFGIEHCLDCEQARRKQSKLRKEREELFSELESISRNNIWAACPARKNARDK